MVILQRNISCKRVWKVSWELQYGVEPFFLLMKFHQKERLNLQNGSDFGGFNCEKKR
jgi:hypothetical protein